MRALLQLIMERSTCCSDAESRTRRPVIIARARFNREIFVSLLLPALLFLCFATCIPRVYIVSGARIYAYVRATTWTKMRRLIYCGQKNGISRESALVIGSAGMFSHRLSFTRSVTRLFARRNRWNATPIEYIEYIVSAGYSAGYSAGGTYCTRLMERDLLSRHWKTFIIMLVDAHLPFAANAPSI